MSRSRSQYYALESLALMHGLNPERARFQLRQIEPVGTFTGPIIEDVEVATETKFPTTQGGGGGGVGTTPGAVPVCESCWNFDVDPATYTLGGGETLVGLSKTYLRDAHGTRWREIWNFQTAEYRSQRSPDTIFVGDILLMPPEATENMQAYLALGKPANKKPGELTKSEKTKAKAKSAIPYVLAGGGIAAAGALLYYAMK